MSLTKASARSRWAEAEFQHKSVGLVAAIAAGSLVLKDADLAGIAIGGGGPVEALSRANLYRARVEDSVMDYADLACSMSESEFRRVEFQWSKFDRCVIGRSHFSECNFSGSRLVVNLDDTVAENCDFSRVVIAGGRAGHEYGGRRAKFLGCNFKDATFKSVEFRASQFVGCLFEGTKFIACDLRGVKVTDGRLPSGSQFEKMDIPQWAAE